MSVVLDIETATQFRKGDRRPREMQLKAMIFGIAITYDSVNGQYKEWTDADLIPLWEYLKNRIVCGWNIVEFDIPVIRYTLQGDGYPADETIMAYDLYKQIKEKTGRWYGLEMVAQANLGRGKTGDGLQAAHWLSQWLFTKDPALLRKTFDYCRDDVELEYSLYAHLMSGKPLRLPPLKKYPGALLYHPTGKIIEDHKHDQYL